LWPRLAHRLPAAAEIDILAAFVQPSGLDVVQSSLFAALRAGAAIRILVGDYLGISSPEALRRLFVWNDLLAAESIDAKLAVRLVRTAHLRGAPESFHPKAWRIADAAGALAVVGSSNLSRAALVSGVEWNVLLHDGAAQLHAELNSAFSALWDHAVPLSPVVIAEYAASAATARAAPSLQPETEDAPAAPPEPRPWQSGAAPRWFPPCPHRRGHRTR
jgi:HKD family nuclease